MYTGEIRPVGAGLYCKAEGVVCQPNSAHLYDKSGVSEKFGRRKDGLFGVVLMTQTRSGKLVHKEPLQLLFPL